MNLPNIENKIKADYAITASGKWSLPALLLLAIVALEFLFSYPRFSIRGLDLRLMNFATATAFTIFIAFFLKSGPATLMQFIKNNSALFLLLILFAGSGLISFALSMQHGRSLNSLFQLMEYSFLVVYCIWAIEDKLTIQRVFDVVLLMCLAEAAIGFAQFILNYGDLYIGSLVRVSGTLGYFYSTHLLVGFIIAAVYSVHPTSVHWKRYMIIASILFSALLLAQVRIIWLLLLFSVFVIIIVIRSRASLKRILLSLTLGVMILLSIVLVQANIQKYDYFSTLSSRGTDTGFIRLELWRTAVEIFRNYPITGVGPGNYKKVYRDDRYSSDALRRITSLYGLKEIDAHSNFFTRLAEMGLLGFFAYYAFQVYLLRTAYKVVKIGERDRISMAVIVVIIVSFFTDFISDSLGGKLFWIFAGLLMSIAKEQVRGNITIQRTSV